MTSDDRDAPDRDVTPFARDAAGHLERQIGAARPAPDFAAMMLRARALVDAGESADAPLAPVIPLARSLEAEDADEDASKAAALAPFTAALRAELDAKTHARSLAGIPPLRATAAPRRRGAGLLLGLLAAAAAVLFLAVGPQLARKTERDGRGVEANAIESVGPRDGVTHSTPVQRPREQPAPATPPPAPVEDPPVPEDSIEAPPPVTSPATKASPRKRRPVVDVADAPAQVSLEDEAQALWQRGELAAAERKLREVLAAGSERRAELAYGDLFALTRQMRGAAGQAAVWREYLARFPRGSFADDARAGLCQRAPADERAACWQDYLVHHPAGAHRKQAQAQAQGVP